LKVTEHTCTHVNVTVVQTSSQFSLFLGGCVVPLFFVDMLLDLTFL
jgi:hypothetical protein